MHIYRICHLKHVKLQFIDYKKKPQSYDILLKSFDLKVKCLKIISSSVKM